MTDGDLVRVFRGPQALRSTTEIPRGEEYSNTHSPAVSDILQRRGYQTPDLSAFTGPATYRRVDMATGETIEEIR